MFGYSKYCKDELKYKDFRRYSNYYCALCNTLGHEYGLIHRLFLSYDTTFILICLDSVVGEKNVQYFRCPFNPIRKVQININEDALEYVAFLNHFLITQKIKDNIIDEKSSIKRMFWKALLRIFSSNKKYRCLQLKYKELSNYLTDLFDKLYNMECNSQSFDDITNTFGEISKSFVKGFLTNISLIDNNCFTALESIFFNMGKWIYIADALDDYHTDINKGRFNLLTTLRLDNDENKEFEYAKSCALLLDIIHAKMMKAFSFIKWQQSRDLISNILFDGTSNTFRAIIKRHYTLNHSTSHGGLANWISRTLNH